MKSSKITFCHCDPEHCEGVAISRFKEEIASLLLAMTETRGKAKWKRSQN